MSVTNSWSRATLNMCLGNEVCDYVLGVDGVFAHLQGGYDLISHFLHSNHIAAHVWVDNMRFLLPANLDGLFTVSSAAHLSHVTLFCSGGVGVRRDHGRN